MDVIGGEPINFSQNFACPDCGISIDEIEPRSFSFNNPFGACPECFGLGYKMEFDEDLIIPDKNLSISEGAITVMGWQSCTDKKSFTYAILDALSKEYKFSLDTPFKKYPKKFMTLSSTEPEARRSRCITGASGEKASMTWPLKVDPQRGAQIPGDVFRDVKGRIRRVHAYHALP